MTGSMTDIARGAFGGYREWRSAGGRGGRRDQLGPGKPADFHDHEDFLLLCRIKVFAIMKLSLLSSDAAAVDRSGAFHKQQGLFASQLVIARRTLGW
jgi:hypothetical protein